MKLDPSGLALPVVLWIDDVVIKALDSVKPSTD
jgi:hypothetical protein